MDRQFLLTLTGAGLKHMSVPLFSHVADVHDTITQTKTSFVRTSEGLRNILYLRKIGCEVDVSSNPFSMLSWDYWQFLWYGGWNRTAITAEACSGQKVCLSGLPHGACTYAKIAFHHHHTHKLIFKDAQTGEYLDNVEATYYDGYETLHTLNSGGGNSVQWSDAHPLLITHRLTRQGYKIRTPIFDHRGLDSRYECFKEAEVLLDKLVTAAVISFDKPEYLPEEVMDISYDTMFRQNCKIKLYDASHNLVMLDLRKEFTSSPPTVRYALQGPLAYGQWAAVLEDENGDDRCTAEQHVC